MLVSLVELSLGLEDAYKSTESTLPCLLDVQRLLRILYPRKS